MGLETRRRVDTPGRSVIVLAVICALLAVACGDDAPASTERPLTFDEASQLAMVQRANYGDGGALVEVNSSFLTDGSTVSMQAEVDWVNHSGRAMVMATGRDAPITEVYWTESMVLERVPALDPLLEARGLTGVRYVARPPDTETRQLDRAIALLVGLAAEAPDNPVLVQQKAGSAFMRDDELSGVPVRVMRYGDRTIYWLDAAGVMLRFEGNSSGLNAPIVIDVIERGMPSIEWPADDEVVLVEMIREVYDAVMGS